MAGYNEIVLAAWLHDIGKFARSAGEKRSTEQILQSLSDCFPGGIAEDVIRLVNACNNPCVAGEQIIAHSSMLSKGKLEEETPSESHEQALVHLVSILRINDPLKENEKQTAAYSLLKPLEDDAILACGNKKTNNQEYQELWKQFESDFHALKGLTYFEFTRSLDTLMERYCWCIPSSTDKEEDISLYQHSKLTAAFAGALYRYYEKNGSLTESALNSNDEAFFFVQGDMSGIQKYIFDIKTHEHSAKLLRARSFQVWALCEIIAEYIAEQFGVFRENIITSSGGKFLLLLPNIREAKTKLEGLRLEIETHFLKEFAGKIAFVLSEGVPASSSGVQKENMRNLFNMISMRGDEAKQKKMQAALSKHGHILENLYDDLQKNKECSCCETLAVDPKYKDEKRCKNCNDLIKIGEELVKSKKIILETDKLSSFDKMVKLTDEKNKQFGYLLEYKAGSPLLPLPYEVPFESGKILTFEQIAEKKDGDKKLAMFKADVDNLGLIFSSSLEEKISFSRYAQLSRQLHYFFSAYTAWFIRTKYSGTIYTVFSGGDDICLLGAWDTIMDFAFEFRKKFSEFTNNNPYLTLSAGIALANPKLPVRSIAAMAEEALEKAKNRKDKNDETKIVKNGISVFGVTVSWEEYEQSLKDGKEILEHMKSGRVSSAVVYKMIDFANRAQRAENGDPKNLLWMSKYRDMLWKSNYWYVIARNVKPVETPDCFRKFGVSPAAMINSRIAVSYALYKNRKGKEVNDAH
jgi:CRISPR-associated protein Csm1